ncbi:2-dehydropantoate 2-reductase [Methylopila turkensis]|uniref:2-dehydropantoate 2-reductase n=1 Tax=Methylopila turkensis TaxID=1437816 RepID=A0A9W6JMR2_9HYPH|nr:2-dehydropantoate 2-reductase [Methylopila turkensis]GLK80476.1 2-dehydropantoate 2-reductase [Methylopila turkensis]
MRLLILGAGGIGGYYGARLAEAGVDVTFLVRPARAERLARDGLTLTSPLGDVRRPVAFVTDASETFDAVLLSCKAYDLDSAIDAVRPAVAPETLVLPLLNGVRHLDALDAAFGRERVLGGVAHIGVTMAADGTIRHLNKLHRFVLGARDPAQEARAAALHAELLKGGFAPELSADVMQDMWEKFTMLAAFAGLTCLMRAPVGAIMQTDDGPAIAQALLDECAAVSAANGHVPREAFLAQSLGMLTAAGSPATASMLRDVESGGRTEHDHILGDLRDRGRAAGVAVPTLALAYAHMQAYAARKAAEAG